MNNGDTAEVVCRAATAWIGTPYRHQGHTRGIGCDCLGMVRGVWRDLYGEWPEVPAAYAPDWAEAGGGDPLLDAARRWFLETPRETMAIGDLVLFRWKPHLPAKHVGILVGSDQFVHAYQGHGVVCSTLVPQWRRRIAGAFRFPDLPAR